jgi:hypothetical protein
MDTRRYCVYNPKSECFLSLGVTREDRGFARIKDRLRRKAARYDEGHWLSHQKGIRLLRLFSPRDLVFLDAKHRVLRAIESFPPFRFVSIDKSVASVLELPVHSIDSSRTQPGNQLLICGADEMVFRLRSMRDLEKDDFFELSAFGITFAH